MSKNFIQRGEVITISSPQSVKSGDGVAINNLFGIATIDATTGDDLPLALVGVFELAKNTSTIEVGDKLYWDNEKSMVTKTATGHLHIGLAVTVAQANDPLIKVRLSLGS